MLWGVSFDATPISGVVVEFVKLARSFAERGCRVRLDLGYDIKADKGLFFRDYRDEASLLPEWVTLDRVPDLAAVPGYDAEFVAQVLTDVVRDDAGSQLRPRIARIADDIADRIESTWDDLGVRVVVVENGTLPENITYTTALYKAIERYGRRHSLGRFVLWRDHDLMWQSEPGTGKYGAFPYPATPKLRNSPHIRYAALHEQALRKTLEWSPGLREIGVLPNTFTHTHATITEHNAGFRRHYGIAPRARIIARFTRIIEQKRIDRDLHLLARLPRELDAVLFVAGDRTESPAEHVRLRTLAQRLGVADRVVFGGRLAPYDNPTADGRYTVRDLLAHATLATFLTSYDYESYGNPIGEAIASGTPYAASRYELYDTVYGDKGFQAPLLDVRHHDLPTDEFVADVADLLADDSRRRAVVAHNQQLGLTHFDHDQDRDLVDNHFSEAVHCDADDL